MNRSTKKFIAVLMLLWLPIFTGSALAASVSMQMAQGGCHDSAMAQAMLHHDMDMGEHQMHHGEMPAPADEHSPAPGACGVCQLACTGYLSVPAAAMPVAQAAAPEVTPYLVAFHSHTSTPLLPPPLARA
jgi:hypothetical protein